MLDIEEIRRKYIGPPLFLHQNNTVLSGPHTKSASMAATKLSSQDKKDLEKFTKYLVYKCIQIIVQSRLGEKKKTSSKPYSSGSDWVRTVVYILTVLWPII